jgi:hypothetical protein
MTSMIAVWNDISEHFDFIEDKLVYVDAPLQGLLRAKTGELFAFRCTAVVRGCLWHWVLLPVASSEAIVDDTFERARQAPPERWVSIVEDRRGGESRVAAAELAGRKHEIPASAFL